MRQLPYNEEQARPGHSLGQLGRFAERTLAGTAEQFASLYALAARSLGLPTRVVVGYRRALPEGGRPSSDPLTLTTEDAHAWPEVHFAEVGWVPFEPTPDEQTELIAPEPPVNTTSVATAMASAAEDLTDPPADEPPPPDRPDEPVSRTLIVTLVIGSLLLVYVLAMAAWRAIVRARRRRGPPEHKILGAWAQARATLAEGGEAVGGAMTVGEAAARRAAKASAGPRYLREATADGGPGPATAAAEADERTPVGAQAAEPLLELAPLVAVAAYHPGGATDADADAAWVAADQLRSQVRREQGVRRWAMAQLAPPVRWRSGSRSTTRERVRG